MESRRTTPHGAGGGGGGFGGHRRADQHAVLPAAGFIDQRRDFAAAAAKHDGRNRHALRALRFLGVGRVVDGADGEAGVRVGRGAVLRIIRPTLPVGDRCAAADAFPPGFVVCGEGHVGEQRVLADHVERVLVGLGAGARGHAEIPGLGIDGPQPAIRAGLHPADVIAHCEHFPARHRGGRDQHRKVGLAAGRREGAGHVVQLALRALEADDEHVLGQPSFGARLVRGDAQCMAFLSQQRVAAVAAEPIRSRSTSSSGKCMMKRRFGSSSPVECRPLTKRCRRRRAIRCRAATADARHEDPC